MAPLTDGAIAGIEAPRGALTKAFLKAGEYLDGNAVNLPVAIVRGAEDGPLVYVQGGIHGDEIDGIEIAWELLRQLEPNELAGTVAVVPVANLPAFTTRSRGFALEERILQDGNRMFPGNARGLLTERVVAALFDNFVAHADLTIDLHAALDGAEILPYVHVGISDNSDGWLELRQRCSRAFGTRHLYVRHKDARLGTSDMSRSLAAQASAAGRASIMAEMGLSRYRGSGVTSFGVAGIRNVLGEMGMIASVPPRTDEPRVFTDIRLVYAESGGGLRFTVALGDEVVEGQVIGEVIDLFGDTKEVLHACADGFVLRLIRFGAVASGAEVAWIAS